MILVDTSVWIELLSNRVPAMPAGIEPLQFVTCGPVLQEVLQGLRETAATASFREALGAVPCLGDPLPSRLFAGAAEIYRSGRRRGRTIRSSVDCLVAAIAIEYEVPVWHRGRDYEAIAGFTELRTISLG